jgi:O-antigen ligase/polysaccharide polymerase Wzy-like membrane protein
MVEARGGGQTTFASDRPVASSPASEPNFGAAYAVAAGITVAAILRRGAFYWPDHAFLPALLAVIAAVSVRRVSRPTRAVVAAIAAFAAWWTIAAFGWGIPANALPLLGGVIGFGATLLLGQALPEDQRATVHRGLVLVAAGVAAIGLLGVVLRSYPLAMEHQGLYRLAATLTYANAAGLLLAMLVPVVATAPISPALRRAALCLVLTAVAATLSRGAAVALVVAIPFVPRPALRAAAWPALLAAGTGAAMLATADSAGAQPLLALVIVAAVALAARPPAAVFTPRSPVAIAAAALVLGLLTVAAFAPAVSRRAGAGTLGDRGDSWPAAARAFASHPVVGNGPEHKLLLPDARGDRISRFAHNEYLQVAAGAGIVGMALLALMVATITGAVRGVDPATAAARAALIVLAVGALFDFAWHLPALGITAGWIASLSGRKT